MTRIIIIGGGIIGVASAYFLGKAGFSVHVLEREPTLGALTTAASLQAVRAQFVDAMNIAMMKESLTFYEHFGDQLGLSGYDIGLHQQGYLFVTSQEATATSMQKRVAYQNSHGLPDVEYLEGPALHRRYPFLATEAVAATFRAKDGWLSGHEVVSGFRKAACHYDVSFFVGTEVQVLIHHGGRVKGVHTSMGEMFADAVVLAAGPFTAHLAKTADIDLPLSPVRRHRVVIGSHSAIPHWAPMTVDEDTGAHWRPEGPGAVLAWAEPEEPSLPQRYVSPDPNFVFRVMEGVYRLNPFWLDVAETLKRDNVFLHAGQYTVTPDHNPIIGPVTDLLGLWVISGFSGHGVMAAPASARLLADQLRGNLFDDGNPFALDRPGLYSGGGEKMVI